MHRKSQKIKDRQNAIVEYIASQKNAAISDIFIFLQKRFPHISRITIARDLTALCADQQLARYGSGRGVRYTISPARDLIQPIAVEPYFAINQDDREIKNRFNWEIFDRLKTDFFSQTESKYLADLHQTFQTNFKNIKSTTLLKKEFERIIIEFSWKSSQIEGNTYSLLDTEALIKNHEKAKGKTETEAQMILNHKSAFDFVLQNKSDFIVLTRAKLENVHNLLTAKLGIPRNIRKKPVGITGTNYRPLDNAFQIGEALEKMLKLLNEKKMFFEKSLLALLLLSYIQPFEDGNKRTARMMANALLLAFDFSPISYRAVNEVEYKKASLLFYERNNISYFKQIFIEQYAFAVKNYFQ